MTAQTVLQEILDGNETVSHIGCVVVLSRSSWDETLNLIARQHAALKAISGRVDSEHDSVAELAGIALEALYTPDSVDQDCEGDDE